MLGSTGSLHALRRECPQLCPIEHAQVARMEGQRRQRQAALEAQRAARERAELAQCTFAPAVLPAAPAALQVRLAPLSCEGCAHPAGGCALSQHCGTAGALSWFPGIKISCRAGAVHLRARRAAGRPGGAEGLAGAAVWT